MDVYNRPFNQGETIMTDKIVYTVTESGMDGRAPTSIRFASFDKEVRDLWDDGQGKNKCYYSKARQIVDIEHETKQALAKLDGLQRLMLNIAQR